MRVRGVRLRIATLLAACGVLAVGGAAAYPSQAQQATLAAAQLQQPAQQVQVASDAALPVAQSLTPAQVRRVPATRSRTGRDIPLICPTRDAPRCALSFIKYDTGLRIHPLYGYLSCHTGIDLRGGYGDKIRAAAAGTVIAVIHGDPAYGNVTLIQHDAVLRTLYAHQSRITVHVGQRVGQGEVIGRVGSTGFATGPHLHFEVHVSRRPYDPAGWFGGAKHPVRCYSGTKY
jgi:murein DD-endopeptidase MepM/ murein hydrolase activator NlpD